MLRFLTYEIVVVVVAAVVSVNGQWLLGNGRRPAVCASLHVSCLSLALYVYLSLTLAASCTGAVSC